MKIQDKPFKSRLSHELQDFVEFKQASGFFYQEASRVLHHFDAMMHDEFPEHGSLNKEICEHWIKKSLYTKTATQVKMITPIRQFALYLNAIEKPAYIIPSWIPGKVPKYEAHIFTETELQQFFEASDRIPPNHEFPTMYLCVPALFRLLYSTGLRSSEARLLKLCDVDLDSGKLTIRNSKFRRKRIVVMSHSMLDYMQKYNLKVRKIFPEREALFPNHKGVFYSKSRFDDWFHMIWDSLPVASDVAGNSPRLHDFRHTFAVHCINRWVKNGLNINCMYPYLSEYMGHESYNETDYYLSLSSSFYPEFCAKMQSVNKSILPEVII